jgi:hypothetical protein
MTGSLRTPATEGLIEARKRAELATESERVIFHEDERYFATDTSVAKILYLAKKARPDLLLTVCHTWPPE